MIQRFTPTVILVSTLLISPLVFSASVEDDPKPKPTETTEQCEKGTVWDKDKEKCIPIQQSRFDDDAIFHTARELAYADRYEDAIALLQLAANGNDPRILNYLGFSHRKAGDVIKAMEYYSRALAIDPDYLLARSYMGQGLLTQGRVDQAKIQLDEISRRGGENTWAYRSLALAFAGYNSY